MTKFWKTLDNIWEGIGKIRNSRSFKKIYEIMKKNLSKLRKEIWRNFEKKKRNLKKLRKLKNLTIKKFDPIFKKWDEVLKTFWQNFRTKQNFKKIDKLKKFDQIFKKND